MNLKPELAPVREGWGGWSLRTVLLGTFYLLVTGLVILLAPFGRAAQASVLLHTLLGILFLVPFFAYLLPHFIARWRDKLSHLLLLGYMAGTVLLAVVLSGIILTVQAAFGSRISYGWDLAHIITGCAVGAIVVVHMATAVRRAHKGEGRFATKLIVGAVAGALVLSAGTWLGGGLLAATGLRQPLPEAYGFRYGDNPFAPSLARTDWFQRLEKDRAYKALLESLAQDPAQPPERLAAFLDAAERQLETDRACKRRGERHVDALGRLDSDARRIRALREIASTAPGERVEPIAALLLLAQAELDESREALQQEAGLNPNVLAGSRSCGAAGCHEEILAEWEPSAHRYASRSAFFQLIQGAMAESNGAESTRYCAGCHDPISLFSGAKNLFKDDLSTPGADEGVSCVVCHSIVQTDVQGNANYVVAPPERYVAEDGFLGRFLIRAYPRHHKATFGRPMMETAEFCGACHKQFIDEQLNRSTRVQLQNQYDAWKGSHWYVPDPRNPARPDPEKALTCRDCHMRLALPEDPGTDLDKHRHHGFVAANQWLPRLHDLPHADRHVALTEQWLKGETVIPEIADRWPGGPPVPLAIQAPEVVRPGEKVRIRVIADNRKVGHTFPTGPLDVIQSWVEVRATQGGKEIFRSGDLDENGFIRTGSWMFKAEGVDRAGNLIDRHNLWDMVGSRFRRVLFPGFTDREEYTFTCACEDPVGVAGSEVEIAADERAGDIEIEAILHYRKVDQTLLNVLQPDGKARAPVTDMSRATARVRVDRQP
ncbi:MAG TPA: multiheme c-type cytochrome [Planctomycetota bacterium]|nr:multiheme c-type cytochrome [Planctomycetota bacterium]